ncbi:ankyrin repeat domain-containing protein [Paracoccus aminophilus]|uniref:Ankyrin repeat protein n=1 Tax=Paracoccus aminophilus JCM 7686 TaxID=1367847 RepID=S5XK18_PARAH|nr:ankyrin repeat domain-containing protein [Paracoccus aminophilus]AGT07524.1 ankyrin repeat protein [Paracoccus aminophilus JCM 7686]
MFSNLLPLRPALRPAIRPAIRLALCAALALPSLAALPQTANAQTNCAELDPNGRDSGGDTHFATTVMAKKFDVVKAMLACGADVNLKTDEGWTPLHTAAYWGPADMVRLLIANGADVNAVGDYDGWTPLLMAVSSDDDPEVVKALLEAGADKNAKTTYKKQTAYELAQNPKIKALLK